MSGRRGPTMRRRCGRRSRGPARRPSSTISELPFSTCPPPGVREAAAEAEWSFLMEDEEGPVGVAIAHPDVEVTTDESTDAEESADDARDANGGDREAELLALWVHPNHAGEGVASELLARIASSVADRGVGTLRATVPADSPGATEFFSAHGFVHRAPVAARRVTSRSSSPTWTRFGDRDADRPN